MRVTEIDPGATSQVLKIENPLFFKSGPRVRPLRVRAEQTIRVMDMIPTDARCFRDMHTSGRNPAGIIWKGLDRDGYVDRYVEAKAKDFRLLPLNE